MLRKAFGTHYIAGICQVTRHTVARWIEEGKMPAYETAGGQRRVWAEDLAVFLKAHNIPVPAEVAASASWSALVVDDDSAVRRIIVRALESHFPHVPAHEAENGFEAGHKLALLLPALLIIDLHMPGIDGDGVCGLVRRERRLSGTRILAMSGIDPEEARARMLEAGADDFIAKPFSVEELAGKVGALLAPRGAP